MSTRSAWHLCRPTVGPQLPGTNSSPTQLTRNSISVWPDIFQSPLMQKFVVGKLSRMQLVTHAYVAGALGMGYIQPTPDKPSNGSKNWQT